MSVYIYINIKLKNPTADPGVMCCRRGAPRDGRVLLLHDGLLPLGAHTALRGRGGSQPLWRRLDNGVTIEHCTVFPGVSYYTMQKDIVYV